MVDMKNQQDVLTKSSFFDDAPTQDYTFWRKNPLPKKHSETIVMQGILFRKSSNFWKSRYYVLYEDRLAYYKNAREAQEQGKQGYCLIQNMRLELIHDHGDNRTDKEKEERHGLRLVHNRQSYDLYARSKELQEKWIEALSQYCVLTNYSASFENVKVIGQGRFACVHLAKRKQDNLEFAVKTFSKQRLTTEDKAQASLINEINILRKLEHDNIIKLFNIYESDHHIYLVLELLRGGELFERIVQKRQYNENDAAILMKKLLSALAHMHSKGIMHRDLKPENLILKDTENDWEVKIADFGLATNISGGEHLFRRCGTPGYVAPEILADMKYNEKVDVFSAGVILYILLTGGSPFYSEVFEEILWRNQNCEIDFNFAELGFRISPAAVDLMQGMLEKDPQHRLSTHEALQHEWITSGGAYLSPQSNTPIYLLLAQENMRRFQEEHGFVIKGQKIDRDVLERAIHAPSPLITGRVESIADPQAQFIFNSPEMSIGAALANRQMIVNLKSPHTGDSMASTRDGSLNQDMMQNVNSISQNRSKHAKSINQYMLMNQLKQAESVQTGRQSAPINQRQAPNPELTAQKVQNVKQNLLKYLQQQSPQIQHNMGSFGQQQYQPQQQFQAYIYPQYQPQYQQHQVQHGYPYMQQQQQQQQQYQQAQCRGYQQPQTPTQSAQGYQQQIQHHQQQVAKKAKNVKNNLKQLQ